MSPPDAERRPPGRAAVQATQLRLESTTDQPNPPAIPACMGCGRPALRVGADGRPWHSVCEPTDVGLTDPETSHKAARAARKGTRSPLARRIFAELVKAWPEGLTDDELAQRIPDAPVGSIAKRRLDLCRAGRVTTTTVVPMTRETRWGREATVWFVLDPEEPL